MIARPHTVGYVTQAPFVGGAERSLLRLAGGLDPARYRPLVIAGRDGQFAAALRSGGIDHRCVALPAPDRGWPWPFASAIAKVVIQLRRGRAALVHINDAPAHPIAAIAGRVLRLPRICHLRFTYPSEGLRWYLKWGFERAVFPSRFLQHHAQSCCPELFPAERCSVVHNGFDPPPPPAPGRLSELRRTCHLDGDAPLVGFAGRVIDSKGVADFLHMAAALARQVPSRFLLIGDDQRGVGANYRTEMEVLAQRLGIGAACRFLGFRDDVWKLLHLCDVVVVPSRLEAFGNVAIEAAAAARPVVATRVGGLPEAVRHGETGLLVDAGDPDGLTDAVLTLLRNPALRHQLGAAGRAHASAQFSLQEHVARLTDLYDEIRDRFPHGA